uniref:Squalene monooxygenase n=1 Tax=Physcomitrium patens TaxID=3218 RepID=A0A2K1JH16_PHYPA|nr:hypothetical protein PHYPA_018250 [Physcomitrium patens]
MLTWEEFKLVQIVKKVSMHREWWDTLYSRKGEMLKVKLEQAIALGLIENEGVVTSVKYRTLDSQKLEAKAPLTFVCDGCFSNLRRKLCEPKLSEHTCITSLPISKTWSEPKSGALRGRERGGLRALRGRMTDNEGATGKRATAARECKTNKNN